MCAYGKKLERDGVSRVFEKARRLLFKKSNKPFYNQGGDENHPHDNSDGEEFCHGRSHLPNRVPT